MSAPLDLTRAPATDPLGIYRFRDGLYAVDLIAAAPSGPARAAASQISTGCRLATSGGNSTSSKPQASRPSVRSPRASKTAGFTSGATASP